MLIYAFLSYFLAYKMKPSSVFFAIIFDTRATRFRMSNIYGNDTAVHVDYIFVVYLVLMHFKLLCSYFMRVCVCLNNCLLFAGILSVMQEFIWSFRFKVTWITR